MRPHAIPVVTLLMVAMIAACGGNFIENTEIPDTSENRVVYDRVMAYRQAMEERNVEAVMSMVSRRYYENAATTDRDHDDYGYERLVSGVLPMLRENIKAIQYRVLMREIHIDGDRAWADYEFFCNYKYVEGGSEGWRQLNDFNRLEFIHEDGAWKIASGL